MTETKIRPQSILLKVATTELTPSYVGMLHLDSNNILRVDTVGAGVPANFVTVLPEHTINGNHGPKVSITQTAADNALVIAKNGAGVAVDLSVASGGTGTALNISNSGTGYGLRLNQIGEQIGIHLTSSSTGYVGLNVVSQYGISHTMTANSGFGLLLAQQVNTIEPNSGYGLLSINKSGTGASPAAIVYNYGTGAGIQINQTGNGKGLSIAQAGSGNAIAITKTSTDANSTVLVTVSSGTGVGIQINQAGNGNALAITKTSTDNSATAIVAVASGSGVGLYVTNGGTGIAAQIIQNGANRALDINQNAAGHGIQVTKTNVGAGTPLAIENSGTGAGIVVHQIGAAVGLAVVREAGGVGTEHCILITNNGVGQDIIGNASNWYISKLGNATFAYVNATTLSHGGHFVKIVDRTISGDAITIDSSVGMVRLIPESGNHDHLGYIHGGSDGQILIVAVKNAGQSVEPVEPGGADSINDGGGRNLDNRSDRVAYMFDAPIGQWCELHFTNNA